MKIIIIVTCLLAMLVSSCTKKQQDNPLLGQWNTPFESIPFKEIEVSDYEPAFKEAIKQHKSEIDSIINNKQKPDFNNTIAAFDYSGRLLNRVKSIYENMISVNTDDKLQSLQYKITPMLSNHEAEVKMNEKLFNRIKTVWDNRSKENLNEEQKYLLKKVYNSFVKGGALLSSQKKEELKKLKSQEAILNNKYNANVLAETKNYKLVISDTNNLKGLPSWLIQTAAKVAKDNKQEGKYIFTLDNASVIPFLMYADNRSLREEIFKARINRCNTANQYDNNKITAQILELRTKIANILGYQSFAQLELENRMVKTPHNADSILENCLDKSIAAAKKDISIFQSMLSKDNPKATLEGWDMYYYAEKLRKSKYNFDENQTRAYFEIENVKQGCFSTIKRLYGLTFDKVNNVQTYAENVDVYQVKNEKGDYMGLLYFDPYVRAGKSSGAWCSSFATQYKKDGKKINPIVMVAFNYAKQEGRTTLTSDEALTIFHEMGHAINELLSNATYPSTSGTNVPIDFVELPSQLLEHWCMQPQVLETFAKDENGQIIPQSLINKITLSSTFNQGFMFSELLAAAWLDMRMHSLTVDDTIDVQSLETQAMQKIKMPKQIPPRYRSTYFTHVFGGGYAAGYYCYIYAEILDADAFETWKQTGDIFNKEVSHRFQEYILSKGGTDEPDIQYYKFRGKNPDMRYMLKNRGLLQ